MHSATETKVNIGCGGAWKVSGWIGIDQLLESGTGEGTGNAALFDSGLKRTLPFPTNSVDVIFSSHTLEHFTYEEGTALLFEIYRVLKVGAPLCLVVPDLDMYIANFVAKQHDFFAVPKNIGGTPTTNLTDNFLMNFYSDPKFNNTCHKYAYNFENLSAALSKTGFTEIEKVGFHEFSYWPELQNPEFRGSIPHAETCSLSVQCRKVSFDSNYKERSDYKEAEEYSRFQQNEQQLALQLNAALLINEGLRERVRVQEREVEMLKQQNGLLALKLRAEQASRSLKSHGQPAKALSGLEHYLREGASKGLTPSPRFDGNLYLRRYADVTASGINPLLHFVQFGAAEGRSGDPDELPASSGRDAQYPLRVLLPNLGSELFVADELTRVAVEKSQTSTSDVSNVSPLLYSPVISLVLPTSNTSSSCLREIVQSVRRQSYPAWELLLLHDASADNIVPDELQSVKGDDDRVKIYSWSNVSGIGDDGQPDSDFATGEFVCLLRDSEIFAPNALWEVVKVLRDDPRVDVIYTDYADLDDGGVISEPVLKPDWSPEFYLSIDYISHFVVIRRATAKAVGALEDRRQAVREIALLWKLAEAGSIIRHLRKVLCYRRTRRGSTVSAKSIGSIASGALQAHNEHLERTGIDASVTWPDYFRSKRVAAYKVNFPESLKRKVAIVIPLLDRSCSNLPMLLSSVKRTVADYVPPLHVIGKGAKPGCIAGEECIWHSAENQSDFDQLITGIDCEDLVFLSPGALVISPTWLIELVGYLSVSPDVGAVGGKILDDELRVRAGGVVMVDSPQTICYGQPDESDGYWFRGRLASDVEAVSSKLLAMPKQAYLQAGGLLLYRYGDGAGTAFGLWLRASGYRVVYNPWSKIVDFDREDLPADLNDQLTQEFGDELQCDRYHHPFLSRERSCTV